MPRKTSSDTLTLRRRSTPDPLAPRRHSNPANRVEKPNRVEKGKQKSDRSHEENQERAYVAASRRADRSLEARLQSARAASLVHKRRTGKNLRITEQIVKNEEMYEEEEEPYPRRLKLLGPHMHTSSPEMNLKMEAYLSNKMAMSAMVAGSSEAWRQNEINQRFAKFFPDANKQARELSRTMSRPGESPTQSPISPTSLHPAGSTSPTTTFSLQQSPSMPATPVAGLSPSLPHCPEGPASFTNPASMEPGPESAFTSKLSREVQMLLVPQDFSAPTWMDQSFGNADTNIKTEESIDFQPNDLGYDDMPLNKGEEGNWPKAEVDFDFATYLHDDSQEHEQQ